VWYRPASKRAGELALSQFEPIYSSRLLRTVPTITIGHSMTGNTRRKRPLQRSNSLKDIGQMLGAAADMTGKAAPVRRKRVLTPPIIDPPLRGTDGVWPDIIATVRPLPADPFDGPPGLGIWFNGRPVVRVPEMAAWFNETAKRAGLHVGMVCGTDSFDIWETVPGDCVRAELTDKGPVGQFLRVLTKFGGFSKVDSPEQHARAVQEAIRENNTSIVEANERVLMLAPPERDIADVVRRCERMIYEDRSPPVPAVIPKQSDLPTWPIR
jgi:hypothetical protein